jgi:hypothetical protein
MRNSEFTEKQLKEIYAFLETYVDENYRVEAGRTIKSLIRYDRTIWKQRLQKTWNDMLSKIDTI